MQTLIHAFSTPAPGPALSAVVVICILFPLLCFVMALFLFNKSRGRKDAEKALLDEKVNEARSQELEWYREKRFLMERQAREKQSRLAVLVDSIAPENSHRLTYPASRLFFLAESIREERQHLGTDISKLSLIDRRLRKLGKECITQSGKGAHTETWLSKMSMCRQMIQSNLEDLRKSQNLLRNVLGKVTAIEESARGNDISSGEMPDVVQQLETVKSKLSELPDGLRTVAKSTGEQAQALFKESTRHIPDEDLHAVWKEQTTLDLFSSKHRPGGRSDLLSATEAALSALHGSAVYEGGAAPFQEESPESVSTEKPEDSDDAKEATAKSDKEEPADTLIGVTPHSKEEEEVIVEVDITPRRAPEKALPEDEEAGIEEMTSELLEETKIVLDDKEEKTGKDSPFNQEGFGLFEFPKKSGNPEPKPDTNEGYRFRTKEEEDIPSFTPPAEEPIESFDGFTEPEEPMKISPGDAVWATPLDFGLDASASKKPKPKFNPYSDAWEKSKEEDNSSLVIFRSDNPEIWNSTTNDGDDHRSIAINEISGAVSWLGIKRLDTGEEVFSEISLEDLKRSGEGRTAGFNGTNEYFYGARHLGFFSEECATEVETLFTYGGWGFGHPSTSTDDGTEQACCWNGKRIPNGTIFEFTLFEERPERATDDQIVI